MLDFPKKHADDWESVVCLALTLNKLGKRSEAETQLTKLAAIAKRYGGGSDSLAYQYGQIQTQWANPQKALDWLQLAVRLRDSGLLGLKTDPLMDPLRREPRFQAIELHGKLARQGPADRVQPVASMERRML